MQQQNTDRNMTTHLQSATPSLKWLQIDFQSLPGYKGKGFQ
jgi:hypothetical protein